MRAGVWAGAWTALRVDSPLRGEAGHRGSANTTTWTSPLLGDGPSLASYALQPKSYTSPALLMLHIFSTPSTASRLRRQAIRSHHPIFTIRPEYRHLIEVKFVLGRYPVGNMSRSELHERKEEEMRIEREDETYGDLIRLERLKNGENMNNGKSLEWVRWIGREGAREANWLL